MDPQHRQLLASYLCSVLNACVAKYDKPRMTLELANRVMTVVMHILQNENSVASQDALSVMTALSDTLEENFKQYLMPVQPVIVRVLTNFNDVDSVILITTIINDMCRILETELISIGGQQWQVADTLMEKLLRLLSAQDCDKEVKPKVVCLFGDFAAALGDEFSRYLGPVMKVLSDATEVISVKKEEAEYNFWVDEMRDGVITVYSQALQNMTISQAIQPHVPRMLVLLRAISEDQDKSTQVLKNGAALVGDLAVHFGKPIQQELINEQWGLSNLVKEASEDSDEEIRQIAAWCQQQMKKIS
jgi:importin subunit beta-1